MGTMRHVTVASGALGEREEVHVHIYETLSDMRSAAHAFNGSDVSEALGVTQIYSDENDRAAFVVVRIVRDHLGTEIVSHEMHHAATALYGAHVGDRISRRAHLNHHNEPFAHLFSDLLSCLVRRLYRLGYYD